MPNKRTNTNIPETNGINDLSLLERDTCEQFPVKITLVLSLTVILTSLTLSLFIAGFTDASLITAWGTCLLCSVVMFTTSKKISQAVWKTLGLALAVSFFGYPVIPALIFGGIISIGAFSALVTSAKGRGLLVPFLLPIASYALAFTIIGDPLVSLSAPIAILPAVPMGITARKKAGMTTSVVASAAVMLSLAIGTAALAVFLNYGELTEGAVRLAVSDITNLVFASTEDALASFEGIEYTEAIRNEMTLAVETYVNSAIGITMATCVTAAYAAIRIQHSLFDAYGLDEHLSSQTTTVTVSLAAVGVYALAYVLSFSLDSSNGLSIVGAVSGNICLALTPCLVFMGFAAIKELPKKLGARGALLSAALILATLFLIFIFPSFIAVVGAVYVIITSIDAWAKEFYSKGDNQ